MPAAPKPEVKPSLSAEEDRVAVALVNRALVTREEIQQCKPHPGGPTGAEALLARLVAASFLTVNQAKRITQELSLLVGQQIPGYQLLEKLGQGSSGAVFK